MAFRPATDDEQTDLGVSTFRVATPEEAEDLSPQETPDDGLVNRAISRFWGSDVDDPLELERIGAVALGSLAGGKAGAAGGAVLGLVGSLVGGGLGAVGGATAGALAPEATLEFMEFLDLVPEGTREQRGLTDAELDRVAKGEALLEVATLGAAGVVRGAGRTIGRTLTGAKSGEELAGAASKAGIELAPFQTGSRTLGSTIVNVLGRFPIIGGKAVKLGRAQEEAVASMLQEAPARIANVLSMSDLGTKIFQDAKSLVKSVGEKWERRYADLTIAATEAGVTVTPRSVREAGQATIDKIASRIPKVVKEGEAISGTGAKASEIAKRFIAEEIIPLADTQTLGQMDELMTKISQRISKVGDPNVRRAVSAMLMPIHGAVKADILKNMAGEGAEEIAERMAKLDAEFSEEMLFLFETSTAKRVSSVKSGGLRSSVVPSKEATRITPERLAKIIIDLDSAQAVEELSRLVDPKTFQESASAVLSNLLGKSMTASTKGASKLNPNILAKEFGVGTSAASKARRQALERLFKDSPLDVDDFDGLVRAARAMAENPVPNVSTFLARKATIGGLEGLISGTIPLLALTGGGSHVGGPIGATIGGLMFLLGGRGLVSAVADPRSAKALKTVLAEEGKAVQKRAAFLQIVRLGANALEESAELAGDKIKQLIEIGEQVSQELFPKKENPLSMGAL